MIELVHEGRILGKYEVDPIYGCWLWRGQIGNNGRPIAWLGHAPKSVYKIVFETAKGLVPAERVLDHVCRRVLCVNAAAHVEAVTKAENEMRKSLKYRLRRKTCARGHKLDEYSRLLTPEMGVLCRLCTRGALQ